MRFYLGADHFSGDDDEFIACFSKTVGAICIRIPKAVSTYMTFPAGKIIHPTLHAFDTDGFTAALEVVQCVGCAADIAKLWFFHWLFSLKEITGGLPSAR